MEGGPRLKSWRGAKEPGRERCRRQGRQGRRGSGRLWRKKLRGVFEKWSEGGWVLRTLHFRVYTLHFTFHTPQSTVDTLDFTLYTLHSTLYTFHSTLPLLHLTLDISVLFVGCLLPFSCSSATVLRFPAPQPPVTSRNLPWPFQLYTWHSTLPHLTLSTVHPSLHTPPSTRYTFHFKLYTPLHSTPHSTLYTLHFPLSTFHFTLHTLHCTHYTLHSKLFTLHSIPYTLHFTLLSHRQASAPICHLHPAGSFASQQLPKRASPHIACPSHALSSLQSNHVRRQPRTSPQTSAAIGNLHYVGSFASQQPPNRASPQRARPSHALVLPVTSHNQL